jgi:protein-disulfide isomerase
LALTLLVITLAAIACNDGGNSSPNTNPCGSATAAVECDGGQPATGTPRTTIAVEVADIVAGNATAFEGIAQDGLALGDPDAPVTIDLYQNFLCAHCRDFARDIVPPLVAEYAADGRARFVFRHVPLGGEAAVRAHEASQCAADQDRFWQSYVQIYANFAQQTEAYSDDRLRAIMANAGVDAAAFDECFDGGEHREKIAASVGVFGEVQRTPEAGFAAATATARQRPLLPVVTVNGTYIIAPTLEEMRALIEEKLP